MTAVAVRPPAQASPRQTPGLRQNNQPDDRDGQRITWAWKGWTDLDAVYFPRDRSIEENLRMLLGRQWDFFSERLGRFISIDDWLTEEEKVWRQRPVLNRIVLWFMLTHARITENPPIIGFLPGPDRADAELAEILDIICKTLWREADMLDVLDRMGTWLLPGGVAHLMSRVDLNGGPWREWVGDADLPLVDPSGQPLIGPSGQPIMQRVPNVPHGRDGQPLVQLTPQGLQPLMDPTGRPLPTTPYAEREGQIAVDVLSPLEVRGEWGPRPWHQKRYHYRVLFLSPEEVQEIFGVQVQADPGGRDGSGQTVQLLDRVLFGGGWYGAADRGRLGLGTQMAERDGLVRVLERWDRPNRVVEGMHEEKGYPGGRYLAVTHNQVLRDGPRPAPFQYTSPIRTVELLRLPGRHGGATPQEFLNSPQRMFNRLSGHQFEHAALTAHPKGLVANGTGLEKYTITQKPGEHYKINPIPGVKALEYVAPPPLSSDLYRAQDALLRFVTEVGSSQPSPGQAPTRDASGELVKELRWDQDRFLGPMTRRMVEELGRLWEDWKTLLPYVFTTERLFSYAGDDNIHRTVLVRPHLFEAGKVNVVADPESMFPEGRGEREHRVYRYYTDGLFGPPGTPPAIAKFFELSRFPHLSRAAKPGGVNRTTAEQNIGKILQGTTADQIPLYPWYDLAVHVAAYEEYMSRPEFVKLDPGVQGQLALMWQTCKQASLMQMVQRAQEQALMMGPVAGPGPEGPPERGRKPARGSRRDSERSASRSRPGLPPGPMAASQRPPTHALAES